ncbi:MAG: glycosyltransferase family 4 protein [Patescibacteria group bacterium]|nr:glycosyltransferase family 4 protein [Patescibacteria group bacterium]MCL5431575.1 glycosyltransferase family 4 protein [Patescibacteria group bacterium]
MKTCFLIDDPSPVGGGPEHLRRVSAILRQKYGCAIDVVTPLTMDQKFNVHDFWQRVKFTFWVMWFLFNSDYDVYHSHAFSADAFLPAVKLRGKKCGITVHGQGQSLVGGGILNRTGLPRLLRWLVLRVWPYDFRLSAATLPGFVRVGNGVDWEEFKKVKRKSGGPFTVLCVSRRDPVKGIDVLEKAVGSLPWVKLNLVSGRRRTLADFSAADIYVLPSLSEGLPIVLLEAMAAKLPVVATNVGDCREIVEAAKCGLIVPPGDCARLAQAIWQLKQDRNRAKMGERGFIYVQKNFSWDKVAAACYSAYRGAGTLL